MTKKLAVFVLVLAFLISASGLRFVPVGLADLNDGQEKHLEPPIISIRSPLNQTHAPDVLLNFSIASPESWLITPVSFTYEIGSGLAQKLLLVTYSIDEEIHGSFSLNSNLSSPFNYSTYLGNLSVGEHSLMVWANATGVVRNWISDTAYNVPISSISFVNFTIDANLPDVSHQPGETGQFSNFSVISVSLVAIVVVLAGLLVYFKKGKLVRLDGQK